MKIVKVKVIKDFNDRTADLVTRKAGKDVLDVTPGRAEELIKKGFVEKVDEPKVKPKTTKTKKTN